MKQTVYAPVWDSYAPALTIGYEGEKDTREVIFPIGTDISEPGLVFSLYYGDRDPNNQPGTKDTNLTRLDAHSLLWPVPNELLEAGEPGALTIWAETDKARACLYQCVFKIRRSITTAE